MYQQVEFASEGTLLRGRFYRPKRAAPFPVVIMTHGTTATISMALDHYAQIFVEAGLGVLLYDHRNFGISGGEPRQQINPWTQARGYRDALNYLLMHHDVQSDRIAAWGDSYSGMIALVVGALEPRFAAVAVQCPTCGTETPSFEPSDEQFHMMQSIFGGGDVSGTPETTVGPMPVVSYDQMGSPSLLKPVQAFRWFMHYGGRHGSHWENRVIRVVPPTTVPFSAFLAAPYVKVPTLIMIGRNDEMAHCNPEVTAATFTLLGGPKEKVEIDGGHFGLLYYPSEAFAQVSKLQCEFLVRKLNA